MSSYKGLVVTFEQDVDDDYAKGIAEAIRFMRGVGSVTPSVSNSSDWMNREQVRIEMRAKVFAVFYPELAK